LFQYHLSEAPANAQPKPNFVCSCDRSHFAISIHRQLTCGSRATHGESAIDNQGLSSDVGGSIRAEKTPIERLLLPDPCAPLAPMKSSTVPPSCWMINQSQCFQDSPHYPSPASHSPALPIALAPMTRVCSRCGEFWKRKPNLALRSY